MARYDDGTGIGPLATRREAFVDAVRCVAAARKRETMSEPHDAVCGIEYPHYHKDMLDGEEIVRVEAGE